MNGNKNYIESISKVQDTTYEASMCKLSSVERGYYHDPFLKYFVKKTKAKSPLINRGYYSRVAGIRMYINLFLKSLKKTDIIQFVNIGGGLDTTFFWLREQYKNIIYFELDYAELLIRKAKIIKENSVLRNLLIYNDEQEKDEEKDHTKSIIQEEYIKKEKGNQIDIINCKNYRMICVDLNRWSCVEHGLQIHRFDFNLPTLFLCECVLIYLEIESSDILIKKLSELMQSTSCIIVYEQMNPFTSFGKVMTENFKSRGIQLKSIYKYNTMKSQFNRFKSLGWKEVFIYDMNEIYDNQINKEDKCRSEKLEMFDEFEEWKLLQNHYFILVAFNCYTLKLEFLEDFLKTQAIRNLKKKNSCFF